MRSAVACILTGLLTFTVGCDSVFQGLTAGLLSNISQLMAQAELIVQEEYENSLLIEVIGTPSGGTASTADDIDTWEFRFVDDIDAMVPGTVILEYADGEFGETEYLPYPLLGTIFERVPRVMSLETAIEKMRGAGYTDDFDGVSLRKPLTNPEPNEAYYVFDLPGKFVLVGMISGEVTEE
jgi:hypothetical protein